MNSNEKNGELLVPQPKVLRPYVRPSISAVPLRPEEAVLGLCKTASTGGTLQAACLTPTACLSDGS